MLAGDYLVTSHEQPPAHMVFSASHDASNICPSDAHLSSLLHQAFCVPASVLF